jgi:predicted metal-dependent HD superfamily phosphohydrolase
VLFAGHDHVNKRGLELLCIAAAYHDAGYIERYVDNEEIGAAMAAAAMRSAGSYTAEEIHEVKEMILSTQLLQSSDAIIRVERTALSGYLMDADLGAFGRDDFFEKCEQLMEETDLSPDVFYRQTLVFMASHKWITNAARELRDAKKKENQEAVERLVRGRL